MTRSCQDQFIYLRIGICSKFEQTYIERVYIILIINKRVSDKLKNMFVQNDNDRQNYSYNHITNGHFNLNCSLVHQLNDATAYVSNNKTLD